MNRIIRKLKLAAALVGGALAIMTSAALADDWHDQTNYPARAVAFYFGSQVLDQNHSVRFGSWTVSFPSRGFAMRAVNNAGYVWFASATADSSTPLVCANAVAGQAQCSIWLLPPSQYKSQDECDIVMNPATRLPIPCPTNIQFQR
jgi:hypothetical protein